MMTTYTVSGNQIYILVCFGTVGSNDINANIAPQVGHGHPWMEFVSWDESSFTSGWRSLMSALNVSAHQHCTHCEETKGARLDVMAPLAPLKDVLLAYDRREGDDLDEEGFRELEDRGGYEELGLFGTDVKGDMPISLTGT
jgi:hypothetical protein